MRPVPRFRVVGRPATARMNPPASRVASSRVIGPPSMFHHHRCSACTMCCGSKTHTRCAGGSCPQLAGGQVQVGLVRAGHHRARGVEHRWYGERGGLPASRRRDHDDHVFPGRLDQAARRHAVGRPSPLGRRWLRRRGVCRIARAGGAAAARTRPRWRCGAEPRRGGSPSTGRPGGGGRGIRA